MENFKLQSWKIKLETWHETTNKSEITGYYTAKNSKIIGSFSWGCFDLHISSIFRFVVDRVAKLVLSVSVAEADDSPAPTLRSSLLSHLLPLPLKLGNSLPNSCVTDCYWFSSISHLFTMFTKWLHYLFWCILTIDHSRVMHWQPAAFTVLMNWLFDRFVSRQKASQTY